MYYAAELAGHLAAHLPDHPMWTNTIPLVTHLLEQQATNCTIALACLRFLAAVADRPVHEVVMVRSDAVKLAVAALAAPGVEPEVEMLALQVMARAPRGLTLAFYLRSMLPRLVQAMKATAERAGLRRLWLAFVRTLTINPLMSVDVAKAGFPLAVVRYLELSGDDADGASLALEVLLSVSNESTHAIMLFDAGLLPLLLGRQGGPADARLIAGLLENLARVPSVRRRIPCSEFCIEVMRLLEQGEPDPEVRTPCCNAIVSMAHVDLFVEGRVDLWLGPALIALVKRQIMTRASGEDGLLAPATVDERGPSMSDVCDADGSGATDEVIVDGIRVLHALIVRGGISLGVVGSPGLWVLLKAPAALGSNSSLASHVVQSLSVLSEDPIFPGLICSINGQGSIMSLAFQCDNAEDVVALVKVMRVIISAAPVAGCRAKDVAALTGQGMLRVLRIFSGCPSAVDAVLRLLITLVEAPGQCKQQLLGPEFEQTVALIREDQPDAALQALCTAALEAAGAGTAHAASAAAPLPVAQRKVIVLGDTNVGKTCVVNRACRNVFSTAVKATLGVQLDFAELTFPTHRVALQIFDTAGQERYRSLTQSFYRGSAAAMLVFDITRRSTFEALGHWCEQLRLYTDEGVVLMVLGTKLDLESSRAVPTAEAEGFAASIGAQYTEVSAVANIGVHSAFRTIALAERTLPEQRTVAPRLDSIKLGIGGDAGVRACSGCSSN